MPSVLAAAVLVLLPDYPLYPDAIGFLSVRLSKLFTRRVSVGEYQIGACRFHQAGKRIRFFVGAARQLLAWDYCMRVDHASSLNAHPIAKVATRFEIPEYHY